MAARSRAARNGPGIALQLAGQHILVDVHVADAGHALELRGRPRQADLDAAATAAEQLADVGQRHQLALAHDGHAVADALDLADRMWDEKKTVRPARLRSSRIS